MNPEPRINSEEVSVTIRNIDNKIIGRDWIHKSLMVAAGTPVRADAILTSYQIGKIPNLRGDSLIRVTT